MKKKIETMVDHFGGIDETCSALGVTRMTLYRWRKAGNVPENSRRDIASKYPQFDDFYWLGAQVVDLPAKIVSELISRGYDVHSTMRLRVVEGNRAEVIQ